MFYETKIEQARRYEAAARRLRREATVDELGSIFSPPRRRGDALIIPTNLNTKSGMVAAGLVVAGIKATIIAEVISG